MFSRQSWTTDKSKINIPDDWLYGQIQTNTAIRDAAADSHSGVPQPLAPPQLGLRAPVGLSSHTQPTPGTFEMPQGKQMSSPKPTPRMGS